MIRINDILDTIEEYHPDADLDLVERAYIYSARVHDGQVRLSGEPYLSHPLAVAWILANMRLDIVSIAAGLLHDVVEDTHATEEEIRELFGDEVAHIVNGVTKISKLQFEDALYRQAESLRKMILAMADDLRVILIKLADRVHNMETIDFHKKEEKKRRIAQETIDIYCPLAARLGIFSIKRVLDEISFRVLYPDEYKELSELTQKNSVEKEDYISRVKKIIHDKLLEDNIDSDVKGRYKSIPSIYQKMKKQNLSFNEVYDLIAFRIIVDSIGQCYTVFGRVHELWRPINNKIKDYIAMPKPNMYQSLHTTVIGEYGQRMEIQIRTKDMDQAAKTGVAAHWSYKEGKTADPKETRTFEWIQNLVENQANVPDPLEFMENVKLDLFPEEVYVSTPTGEVKVLPKGSTPVDFAYSIHTDVGNRCNGSKVNGRMVQLDYPLHSGDMVEILTSNKANPNQDWLQFVKSVKARSCIRRLIRQKDKERSLSIGKELCEKNFKKYKLNFNVLFSSEKMSEIAARYGYKTNEDLIVAVGYGKIKPAQIVNKFRPSPEQSEKEQSSEKVSFNDDDGSIIIDGIDNILTRRAKCCNPVPGDKIIGYTTEGNGISIHRKNCPNVKTKPNPERFINAVWGKASSDKEKYHVDIRVTGHDRPHLARDVSGVIGDMNISIPSFSAKSANGVGIIEVTIPVTDRETLEKIIMKLKNIKGVDKAERLQL